jgi:hypothetical protein
MHLIAMKFGNALIDDGFEPVNTAEAHNVRYGGQAKFSFKSSPKIQNSATSSPDYSKERADIVPSYLKLFGGARVEPVHLGGVIGKGLYLDGKNDHLVASYPVPKKHNQWLIGVWLDSREENNTTVRNVFQFADSSTIGVSLTKIKAYDGVQGKVGEVDISRFGLTANKFFHFSVVIKTQLLLKQRTLEFFINGTKAGALAFKYQWNPGFSFKSIIEAVAYGVNSRPIEEIFVLGATKGLPFKGWVDELRVYGLGLAQDTGTKKELYNDHFWGEFTCNLAYGSIARMSSKDLQSSNDKIRALAQYANRVSPFYPVKTANTELSKIVQTVDKTVFVCEQFKLDSHSEPSDFVPQVEKTICAGRTHLNDPDDEDFQRYCMRPYYMRVHDKKLDPEKPRPNFSQTNFCLSCHHQEAKVAGLGLDALSFKGNILKHADKRRQPLEFPGVLHGCVQESSDAIASSEERCVGDQSSDLFFEGKGKIKPD